MAAIAERDRDERARDAEIAREEVRSYLAREALALADDDPDGEGAMTVESIGDWDVTGAGYVREPRHLGYIQQDRDDAACGRTLTLDDLEARWAAEDEAWVMAHCPPDVHEDSLCQFEA